MLGRSAKAPPNQGGLEGWSAAKSTQHRAQPRPFLHNRTRAPAPPLSGGARARPLRAHRDYALPPSRTESYPAPPPTPLTHPHASRPPALREAEEVSPPPQIHTLAPALPATRLPAPTPARRALTAKLLRPLLTACPSRREPLGQGGPKNRAEHRPAKADWQPPLC